MVVGVDASQSMLARARRKVDVSCAPVRLWHRDATKMSGLAQREPALGDGADGVLFTYALSLMHPWPAAWDQAVALARPGARVVVVDMALPHGGARVLSPLARLACHLGGADIHAHPWTALARHCEDVTHVQLWGGHVQVWAGTLRPDATADGPR